MRDNQSSISDDPVLNAFVEACERPSVEDVIAWTRRHPDRADDIREVADILLEMAEAQAAPIEPSPELVARSRAMTDRLIEASPRMPHA